MTVNVGDNEQRVQTIGIHTIGMSQTRIKPAAQFSLKFVKCKIKYQCKLQF